MKYPVIVHKEPSWTSPYAPAYQDESSKLKLRKDVSKNVRLRAVDYLSKETHGQVFAGGFMRDLIARNRDGTFSHPESLSNEQRKHRLIAAWKSHGDKFKPLQVTHHRLEFSMSNDFRHKLLGAGLKPDAVLHSVMKQSLRRFQENFYPGDSIGYSYGFHHDTENLHVHVFIHPRTQKGGRVGISSGLKWRTDKPRRNQLGFLKASALVQAERWIARCDHPEKQREFLFSKEGHRFFVDPVPTTANRVNPAEVNPRINRLQEQYKTLGLLRQEMTEIKQNLYAQRTTRLYARLVGWRMNPVLKIATKVGTCATRERYRRRRTEYGQLRRDYLVNYREVVTLLRSSQQKFADGENFAVQAHESVGQGIRV